MPVTKRIKYKDKSGQTYETDIGAEAKNITFEDGSSAENLKDTVEGLGGVYAPLSHTHQTATQSQAGFMSAADKTKLDNSSEETAQSILGKLQTVDGSGSGLDADLLDGKHASEFANNNHVHGNASASSAGFMSAADKTKLDGIETGATNVSIINNLTTSTSGQGALDAYQGKILNDNLSDIEDKLFADPDTNRYTSFTEVPAKSGLYRIYGTGGAPYTSYSTWSLLLLEAGTSTTNITTKYFTRLAFYCSSTSATNYDMYYSKASHNGTSWSAGTWYKIWNEYNDSGAPFLLKTGGTMTGTLTANNSTTWTTGYVRNIKAGTAAPTTSTCPLGQIYLQYE